MPTSDLDTIIESLEERALLVAGTFAFATSSSMPLESAGSQTVAVTLTTDAPLGLLDTMSVDVVVGAGTATGGGTDYTFTTVTKTFTGDGVTTSFSQNVSVSITDDRRVEGNETVRLDLSTPTHSLPGDTAALGSPNQHTVTIDDNDVAVINAQTDQSSGEATATPSVNVTLSIIAIGTGPIGLDNAVTVLLTDLTSGTATGSGTDYTFSPAAQTLTFTPGTFSAATQSADVTVVDDKHVEGNETINFSVGTLSSTLDGQVSLGDTTHTLTITDNDSALVTYSGTASVSEGGTHDSTSLTATLSLITSGTGSDELDVAVSATVTSPTGDFTADTVTWAAFDAPSAKLITVTAVNDNLVETAIEILSANISAGSAITSLATVSTTGSATVNVTDNDSATVTIPVGTTTVTEGAESLNRQVTLTLTTNGTGPAQLAVPVVADLSANPDYTTTAATFAAGAIDGATANIVIQAFDDRFVEASTETFTGQTLNLTSTATKTASGTRTIAVVDNDSATVSITGGTTSVTEGGSSSPVTVTLALATTGTGSVSLQTTIDVTLPGNADYTASTPQFGINAVNSDTVNIDVSAVNDKFLESTTETFSAQALTKTSTATVTASGSQTVAVTDDESATLAIAATSTVAEQSGAQSVGVVTLSITGSGVSGAFGLGAGVVLSANETKTGGTATSGTDYTTFGTQTVTFGGAGTADGDVSSGSTQNATLTPTNDALVEGPETVTLSLGTLVANGTATTFGNQSNTTTIADNDTATITLSGTATLPEGGTATLLVTLTLQTDGSGTPALGTDITGITLVTNANYTSDTKSFSSGALDSASVMLTVTGVDNGGPFSASLATFTSNASVTPAGTGTVTVDNVEPTVAADNATVTVNEASAASNTGTFGD
ncbi:MAG: hypothetical protein NT013_30415, partial [Planctomycetia bacterium]|nr:hypothetical protein [Planctomycetia bacterium]